MSSANINVMIVIDTDYVKNTYPNPSTDFQNPTAIDHNSQFMICADPRNINNGQGTADLNFNAIPGDNVSFRGISIYGNSDDAVIVYGINPFNYTPNVFNKFEPNLIERQYAVVPDCNTDNGIPPKNITVDFVSYDAKVAKAGTETFMVNFALYTLNNDGETQSLFGYFCWDPTITVS